jgi:hypothetical protein
LKGYQNNSFFLTEIPNEHWLYTQIRDCPKRELYKEKIESFWIKYNKNAIKGFLQKAQREFKQCWWEMYLGIGLMNLGFQIQTTKEGPDFRIRINSKQNIWIEAIAPGSGDPNRTDSLPPLHEGVQTLPEDQFLLRLTHALLKKKDQFVDCLNKKIVNKNDFKIIAISSCDLDEYGELTNFPVPAPLKVLAGVGNLALTKNSSYLSTRIPIVKGSGNKVDTQLFARDDFKLISAVLYSNSNVLNCLENPETSFMLFLNPNAEIEFPKESFQKCEIWRMNNELTKFYKETKTNKNNEH